ncbi:hypothetical protein [Microbacterium hydrocarbonoxydans]|uniref:hypothetical protein n=1 Tax=Microbacterium hydrocarbonoxydans TaxID=273678 RepID=UPI00203D9F62|nr:hypothetical protein [Microbacterium hydrocarbonoxydans]MCM3780718.1 hypothetical protein [Microbacterium hydrocarbonoxydans]
MVFEERNAWTGLVVSVIAITTYVVIMLQQAATRPVGDIDWLPPMLWTIGGGIVVTILVTIVWGIAIGVRDREAATASDIRDRDISRMGGRVEQAFLVIAGLAVIALCAVGADLFWVANTMFAGFAVSAVIGSVARVVAYRRGLV